ncbi:hypothetical protein D9611_005141 [Ephemerocybe angulata]|uniref:Uncharacterized protein n=2 Tax=Ephemerocybe angulata TaxID=980116 RepID=A0A8H5BZV1_9AGAR|nr:hypothetical protein D9611_005141 [Tulosesus angulatus]KAF6754223.1 precursor to secretory protein Ssp120 [Tulosesus angulatus]
MLKPLSLSLLLFVELAIAHGGGHQHSGPESGETIQQYAQRHMSKEHHIDSFDARSFFQLHDLDRDGFWNKEEIEAIYGVHHIYSQKKSKDDIEHQKKADHIVAEVLKKLDLNSDGLISPEELEKVGLDGLPNFDNMGAEGHHYDIESEFFLHHEEEFHSTPETQTDESYTHPEDLEHFAHHEAIENKEAEREAAFQGISVEDLNKERLQAQEAADAAASASASKAAAIGDAATAPEGQATATAAEGESAAAAVETSAKPGVTRVTPPEKQDPSIKFADARARAAANAEWGNGEAGYKPPAKPEEKMRRGLPYKSRMQYKFKRNWGDF